MMNLSLKISMWMLLVLVFAGCAAKANREERVMFPPPPDEPRYEWLGTFYDLSDLKIVKDSFADLMIGEDKTKLFSGPMDVVSTSDGNILVSDIYLRNIKSLNLETGEISLFSKATFDRITGLTVDAQDRIYVADGDAGTIKVFSGIGQPLFVIDMEDGSFAPFGLTVNDQLARLYVSDTLNHAIMVFSLDGEFLFRFGQRGGVEGEFNVPAGMAVDSEGRLFVADMMNARIQVFSADGEFIRMFGARGTSLGTFEAPKGLAFDSDGNLYVVDTRRPNIRAFTPEGVPLILIGDGGRTSHKLGFVMPVGVFVDEKDRLLIVDLMNQRLTVWQYLPKP